MRPSALTNPPGHLWRDRWTAPSGRLSLRAVTLSSRHKLEPLVGHRSHWPGILVNRVLCQARAARLPSQQTPPPLLQGCLAHIKHPSPRTLQKDYTKGPMVVLGGEGFLAGGLFQVSEVPL